jgi:N-sulfoglucosamine sulfohydrolase
MRWYFPIALGLSLLWQVSADAAARNVVLFVTDDQGQDAGCYGNPVIKTPNLDALAADGTRFTHAYCTTASCSPSRSVILTGLFNHANGQYGLEHAAHHFRSFENVKSLPVRLSEAGYRTARIGKFHVAPESVYRFDEKLQGNPRNGVAMAERCRAFVEAESDRPFFLYFCTADPHRGGGAADEIPGRPDRFGNRPRGQSYPGIEPVHYDPADVIVPPFLPDTPACRAELAQYYESVSRADSGLGRLVDILKQADKYDDTLIIYIADNGIPFPGAKTTVYEPGTRLPCVVRNPYAKKRGVVSSAMVSWVDITPTILDFAGRKPRDVDVHGRSFLSILDQAEPEDWRRIYASHTFHEVTMYYPMRVVHLGRYKLIWNIAHPLPFPFASDLWNSSTWQDANRHGENFLYGKRTIKALIHRPQFELYDLQQDPNELHNLADDDEYRPLLDCLVRMLKRFQRRTGDPWLLKWERE